MLTSRTILLLRLRLHALLLLHILTDRALMVIFVVAIITLILKLLLCVCRRFFFAIFLLAASFVRFPFLPRV